MLTSTCNQHTESRAADVLIPLIRAAATISFAVVPCSLGFVIIAVSEQLIRSIMVGDDPEMLVSDLQNQFPNDAIEVADSEAGLAARVVDLIDRPERAAELPLDPRSMEIHMRVRDALQKAQAGALMGRLARGCS
jgi:AraC family transcriptional regulator of adaptative response/methylated-DNA-[protein]-cysteine methyltransferase